MSSEKKVAAPTLRWQEAVFSPERFQEKVKPKGPEEKSAPGYDPNNVVASGVKLLSKMVVGIHNFGLEQNEKTGLNNPDLIKQIIASLPAGGGVLVESRYEEWKMQDPAGNKAKFFRNAYVVGKGKDPGEVFQTYIKSDRLSAGPPEGWKNVYKYYWVTSGGA